MPFHTLDQLEARGKRVLLRADLNVPLKDGQVTGPTRLERLCPTIRELVNKGARVIICSHLGRPKGKRVPEMSLRPVVTALGQLAEKSGVSIETDDPVQTFPRLYSYFLDFRGWLSPIATAPVVEFPKKKPTTPTRPDVELKSLAA